MFKNTFLTFLLITLAANGFSANPNPLDRFSFAYSIQGDPRVRPLQVFDDGVKTYLQYRSADDIPAFITAKDGVLLMPRLEGPYVVLAGVPRDFIAQMGAARVRITHASALSSAPQYQRLGTVAVVPTDRVLVASNAPVAGVFGSDARVTKNDWTDNSYAQPLRGDKVVWGGADTESTRVFTFERGSAKLDHETAKRVRKLGQEISTSKRIVISSADDTHPADAGGSERARVVRNALVASGVSPSVISVQVGFMFDDQLTKSGTKLLNPTSIMWTMPAPVVRQLTRPEPDASASVLDGLRSGRISAAQAIDLLKGDRGVTAKAVPTAWSVRKSDQDIERMLGRWATDAGWRVIWKGAPTILITADAERPLSHPDFLKAADYVISQAKASGYRIKAVAYSNQVLVVSGE